MGLLQRRPGKSNSTDLKFVDVTSLRERETYSEMICNSSGGRHGGGHGRIRGGEGGAGEKAGKRGWEAAETEGDHATIRQQCLIFCIRKRAEGRKAGRF